VETTCCEAIRGHQVGGKRHFATNLIETNIIEQEVMLYRMEKIY